MLRKALVWIVMASATLCGFGQVAAAGEIPDDMLAQMGLGGMQSMSDEEGTQVRGEGLASVLGIGLSLVLFSPALQATDSNSFNASSGPSFNALANGASQTNSTVQVSLLGIPLLSVVSATSGSAYAFGR